MSEQDEPSKDSPGPHALRAPGDDISKANHCEIIFEEYLIWLDEYWELFGPIPEKKHDASKYRLMLI